MLYMLMLAVSAMAPLLLYVSPVLSLGDNGEQGTCMRGTENAIVRG